MQTQRQIVLQLQSLKFKGSGSPKGEPIKLRDPVTDAFVSDHPEWVNGARNAPAAYVGGNTPSLEIGIQAQWFAPTEFTLCAWGAPLSGKGTEPVQLIGPKKVVLTEQDRRVRFVNVGTLPFNQRLPDGIGMHAVDLDWYADWSQDGQSGRLFLGCTPLKICTTWKPMVDDQSRGLLPWAYVPIMEWSCFWAHGAEEPERICDLLMAHLPATGLQYGIPGWDIRSMLLGGGGMCGGWYQLFASLANCQGVPLELETLMLPAGTKLPWQGLVLTTPGLNQVSPGVAASEGHYRDSAQFPPPPAVTLEDDTTTRYWFRQNPDGHSINMLVTGQDTVTIYDPSFQVIARGVKMKPPPKTGLVAHYEKGSSFRKKYLNQAVQFLMSQRDKLRADPDPLAFGVTVETPAIPEITIVWNKTPVKEADRGAMLERLRDLVAAFAPKAEVQEWMERVRKLEGPSLAALSPVLMEAAKELPVRPTAPVPHSMPPSELIEHLLLELHLHDPAPVSMKVRKTLQKLHDDAVSPRLRALAEHLL